MKKLWLIAAIIVLFPFVTCSGKKEDTISMKDRPSGYGTLIGTIIDDDTGDAIPARVYATGSDDSLYAAVNCIEYDRPNFGPRIGYTGRHFTTIGNSFTVHLPPGVATIKIERGKEYIPVEIQVKDSPFSSPDRTKKFLVKEGDSIWQISYTAYGDPKYWRVIAEENNIDDPRFLEPGKEITIPPLREEGE